MKQPGVKALTFDVGGTVFDWRGTIEGELQTLSAEKGVDVDVRRFASDWRSGMFEMLTKVKSGELPRKTLMKFIDLCWMKFLRIMILSA